MPPRWPRKPDRQDPAYRRLDDRMNFALHVAIFAATNSGLWFFRTLELQTWPWAKWVTGGWALALLVHLIYISAIANYSAPTTGLSAATQNLGFKPDNPPSKSTKKSTKG